MYFTALPNHSTAGFDEQLHYSRFKKHNIIFNALSSQSQCDKHVGCLSFKTVLSGEEWYGIDNRQVAVRPGQFLILNDDQTYSSRIHPGEATRVLSIFFKREYACAVFRDAILNEEALLDDPFSDWKRAPEFFQTLNYIDPLLQGQLLNLIAFLDGHAATGASTDEYLVFLLRYMIGTYTAEVNRSEKVNAIKPGTKKEIFRRLCVAKDILHSSYMDRLNLAHIGHVACLSVPQLIRQFKAAFGITPHQYLVNLRLQQVAEQLKSSDKPIQEIAWQCGFENMSAFCRRFKLQYGIQPHHFSK
jgi:AraC family transcriptional regulator